MCELNNSEGITFMAKQKTKTKKQKKTDNTMQNFLKSFESGN